MGDLFGGGQEKAAKIAQQTAQQNNQFAQGIYNSNKALMQPTIDRGNAAGSAYNALLGLGGDPSAANNAFNTFKNSDGYQFRLNQGLNAVNAGAFARGGGLSGATLKALNDYAGNSASGEFGNYLTQLQVPMNLGTAETNALPGQGTTLAATTAANNNTASTAAQNAALADGGILGKLIGAGVNIASSFVPVTSTAGKNPGGALMADGNADWGLWTNPVDSITGAINAGQDRRFLNQQRDFQNQQNAAALAASQRTQAAIPQITSALGNGDYSGAEIAAAVSGNKDLASTIHTLSDQHRQQLADYAGTIGSIAQGLKNIPLGDNGDDSARASAFAYQIPALKAHGATDADILNATRGGFGDAALDGYINSAGTVQQHIDNANKLTELGIQQQNANKPVEVSDGGVLVDPVTRQPVYQAPYKPEVKLAQTPTGGQVPVTIDYNGGGASVGAAGAAPSGTGNTRPERNNNPGNVKALPNGQQWRGQTGVDSDGYAIFGDLASGQRAADRNLQSYARQGINTVSGIVSRWAPRGDRNNTDAYIASVARALGVDPKTPLDLSDPNVRQALLTKGIFPNEGPTGRLPNAAHAGPTITVGEPVGADPNGGAGGLTPQAINDLADLAIANGGRVPPGNARSKAVMVAVQNAMVARAAAKGLSMDDVIHAGQDTKSQSASLVKFATGKQGDTVRSLNVAVQHLALLHDAALALQNGNVTAFNSLSQGYAKLTGSPIPTNFDTIKGVVGDEVTKAVLGSGGALSDRQDVRDNISRSASPAQLAGAIKGYTGLMGGQLTGLQRQYQQSTGRQDFNRFLDPTTTRVLSHGTVAAPVRVTSPQQAAALPSGTRFQTPDGRIITKH